MPRWSPKALGLGGYIVAACVRFACRMNASRAVYEYVRVCVCVCKVLLIHVGFRCIQSTWFGWCGFAARGFMQAAQMQRSLRVLCIKCHVKCLFLNFVNSSTCVYCWIPMYLCHSLELPCCCRSLQKAFNKLTPQISAVWIWNQLLLGREVILNYAGRICPGCKKHSQEE